MRILVVDDELPMRTALTEALRSEDYHVTSAANGEEALEMAFAADYSLILLDVMMPKIDGLSVCKELRKRGNHTPVLMVNSTSAGRRLRRWTGQRRRRLFSETVQPQRAACPCACAYPQMRTSLSAG